MAIGLVFWALRLFVQAPDVAATAVAVDDGAPRRGELSRLLGAEPVAAAAAPPAAASRFKLVGVVAPRQSGAGGSDKRVGVALISVDDKPPRPYRIGARIDGETVLQAVGPRSASIGNAGEGAASVVLDIPPLPAPATGSLVALPIDNSAYTPSSDSETPVPVPVPDSEEPPYMPRQPSRMTN